MSTDDDDDDEKKKKGDEDEEPQHTDSIWCLSAEHGTLYSGSRDTTVRKWEISSTACLQLFNGESQSRKKKKKKKNGEKEE